MDELDRLGRPGAYRLGLLRAAGAEPDRPRPYRPSFARRRGAGWRRAWRVLAERLAGRAEVRVSDVQADSGDETEPPVRLLGGDARSRGRSSRSMMTVPPEPRRRGER
jgi:hypothetical protein